MSSNSRYCPQTLRTVMRPNDSKTEEVAFTATPDRFASGYLMSACLAPVRTVSGVQSRSWRWHDAELFENIEVVDDESSPRAGNRAGRSANQRSSSKSLYV